MSKPLFRKTTTEFTKNDVIDVLLISGLAIAAWELGRRIRNAKKELLDTFWEEYADALAGLDDDGMDDPIPFMPTFVDKLLPEERGLCNSVHRLTGDLCLKQEGHAGTHVAMEPHGKEYSWDDMDQASGEWMCGRRNQIGTDPCTRNKHHEGLHINGTTKWTEKASVAEVFPY